MAKVAAGRVIPLTRCKKSGGRASGALGDIGFTIPGQAWTYWNKGPGPGEDYSETEEGHEWSRKQYLHHERWQLRAAQRKFESMREFAAILPKLRRAVKRARRDAARAALACAVRLLDAVDPRVPEPPIRAAFIHVKEAPCRSLTPAAPRAACPAALRISDWLHRRRRKDAR